MSSRLLSDSDSLLSDSGASSDVEVGEELLSKVPILR
jgi:hypothetical protein